MDAEVMLLCYFYLIIYAFHIRSDKGVKKIDVKRPKRKENVEDFV